MQNAGLTGFCRKGVKTGFSTEKTVLAKILFASKNTFAIHKFFIMLNIA